MSSLRHWSEIIPCPALGIISSVENTSVILSSIDKDSIPAYANIIASNKPSLSFLILVSTFPLISLQLRSDLIFLI